MKKNLFLISLMGALLLASCTPTKILVNFTEPIIKTFEVNGIKDELFLNANRWMISTFKDARSIIQYSDKAEGTLIGKYLLYFNAPDVSTSEECIYAIIEVTVKDRKARISITPDNWIIVQQKHTNYYYKNGRGANVREGYTKEMAIADIDALCESFHKNFQSEGVKF